MNMELWVLSESYIWSIMKFEMVKGLSMEYLSTNYLDTAAKAVFSYTKLTDQLCENWN